MDRWILNLNDVKNITKLDIKVKNLHQSWLFNFPCSLIMQSKYIYTEPVSKVAHTTSSPPPPRVSSELAGSAVTTGQIALVAASLVAVFLWTMTLFHFCIAVVSVLAS